MHKMQPNMIMTFSHMTQEQIINNEQEKIKSSNILTPESNIPSEL